MCGILFVDTRNGHSAVKSTLRRYAKQSKRGKQGFGYIAVEDNKVKNVARFCTEDEMTESLRKEKSSQILLHHRFPTSTENYVEATHPLYISDERLEFDYYIVHNGVIQNAETLYERLKGEGYVFRTEHRELSVVEFPNIDGGTNYEFDPEVKFNDSEALAFELALYFDGKKNSIGTRGSAAFIAFKTKKDGEIVSLIWGHNTGNPLYLEDDKTVFCLKSDSAGASVVSYDTIFTMDWKTKEITSVKEDIGSLSYGYNTSKNVHYKPTVDVPARDVRHTDRYLAPEKGADISAILPIRYPGESLNESLKIMDEARKRTEDMIARDDEREATIDFGPPEDEAIEADLAYLLTEYENEDPAVKTLRKDLRREMYDLSDAKKQLEEAKKLLAIAIEIGTTDEICECEATVEAQEQEVVMARRQVNGTSAELTAFIDG